MVEKCFFDGWFDLFDSISSLSNAESCLIVIHVVAVWQVQINSLAQCKWLFKTYIFIRKKGLCHVGVNLFRISVVIWLSFHQVFTESLPWLGFGISYSNFITDSEIKVKTDIDNSWQLYCSISSQGCSNCWFTCSHFVMIEHGCFRVSCTGVIGGKSSLLKFIYYISEIGTLFQWIQYFSLLFFVFFKKCVVLTAWWKY